MVKRGVKGEEPEAGLDPKDMPSFGKGKIN
jgi:hypothetical protein